MLIKTILELRGGVRTYGEAYHVSELNIPTLMRCNNAGHVYRHVVLTVKGPAPALNRVSARPTPLNSPLH